MESSFLFFPFSVTFQEVSFILEFNTFVTALHY